jgi:N-acylneuraminate cytidylyltransferase
MSDINEEKTRAICIIPARGGSKRIPKKNRRPFIDRPVIRYSMDAARKTRIFDSVIVSSDDDKILSMAQHNGCQPHRRSGKAAADDATMLDALLDVVGGLGEVFFEYICMVYACAPFITTERLLEGYERIQTGKYPVVYPIIPNSHHIEQTLVTGGDTVKMLWPKYKNYQGRMMRTYRHAGQWFWIRTKDMYRNLTLTPDDAGYVLLHWWEGHDIDTEEDWQEAEFKYEYMRRVKDGDTSTRNILFVRDADN